MISPTTLFVLFQKIAHDNDIIFDDSPLNSEDQRFLHKRSINDLDSDDNDEHWLWTHVDRIKRSISNVLGSDNEQAKSRSKRGLFDWWVTEAPISETTTTEAPIPVQPFDWFKPFDANNDNGSNKPSNIEQPPEADQEQADHSEDEDDEDNDIDGSGYTKIIETETVVEKNVEQFCKSIDVVFLNDLN